MTTSTAIIAGLVSAVITVLGALITARVTSRANAGQYDVALSAEARQWVTQAQADAKQAKADAAAASKEAQSAREEAADARRQLRDAADEFDRRLRDRDTRLESLMQWVERVVRTAHDNPDDLVRVVNGGPPEFTTNRLRLPDSP